MLDHPHLLLLEVLHILLGLFHLLHEHVLSLNKHLDELIEGYLLVMVLVHSVEELVTDVSVKLLTVILRKITGGFL